MNRDGPDRPTRLALRLLGVLAAALLLLAMVVAITRDRTAGQEGEPQSAPSVAPASSSPSETASSEPDGVPDLAILDDPAAAEAAGGEAVLAAGRHAASSDWLGLTDPVWHDAMDDERPVYVGNVEIGDDRSRVTFDLVVATRSDGTDRIDLRFLPGADTLVAAGSQPTVAVTVDGLAVDHRLDAEAALLGIDLTEAPAAGDALTVRVVGTYTVPDRSTIVDDGGPAGFGLLARSADVTMIGHGLPLLTFDATAMVDWGDVGAFPAAIWSMQVDADGALVTGGAEDACLDPVGAWCHVTRGSALRDLAIAVFDAEDPGLVSGNGAAVWARSGTSATALDTVHRETLDSLASIGQRLGPLPWSNVDVVLAPLTGAAGMEFPGLVIVDPEYLDRLDGAFGTFVIAHEVAHQWFHALVGNSSLQDSVVDESLAQYASLWYYRDVLGEAAADRVVDRYLAGRYLDARANGVTDVAPAAPLVDFGSNRVYGPMTYARAPFAWVVAEGEIGEQAVVDFLAALVRDHGLRVVTSAAVRRLAVDADNDALVAALDRWWFDPAPAHDEIP